MKVTMSSTFSGLLATTASLLSVVAALPAATNAQPRAFPPLTPANDPFYQPPGDFASTAPGTVLRWRPVVAGFFGLIPDPVETYQLLYRTTAVNGSAIATVTTIFKPFGAQTDRFVAFNTAYDSSATICDPSYNYQLGAPPVDLISQAEQLLLQAYLAAGYIVASPDYEGPDAAFGPGHLEGMGVLDGMRAVSNFGSTLGLTTSSPMIVGVGYSGGAIATGWAAGLQPNYASELDIKGWVAGGTPANLTGTLLYIDDTIWSGFTLGAVAGLLKPSAYEATLNPLVQSIATPAGLAALSYADSNCAVGDIIKFADQSVLSTKFQSEGPALLYNPIVHDILIQNTMGVYQNETPTAPVLLYHASQDEIIPYGDAQTLFHSWCNDGASVKFTTYASGGHLTTEIIGLPEAFSFVQSAFAGTLATSGCSSNVEYNNYLNPLALGVELEPVLVALIQLLLDFGTMDSNIKGDVSKLS